MPALPIMGAVAAGHLLDLISVQTARCCTFPLLRSPSPVETSPASTSFLVSMVAKSSPLASSFKRGCAAGPPCLRRPRGSRPRPTHREDLLAPTGALEQRAAKSLVCAGVLVRSCRAHSTLLHARSTLLLAFRSCRVERVRAKPRSITTSQMSDDNVHTQARTGPCRTTHMLNYTGHAMHNSHGMHVNCSSRLVRASPRRCTLPGMGRPPRGGRC